MATLEDVEEIGPVYANELRAAGVRSTGDLIKKGATPAGRKQIATDSGLSDKLLLEWINHVDRFRIKGVGSDSIKRWLS